MSAMAALLLAATAFVGMHFLLSHPLRDALVARLGENAFRILYSLIALASFGGMLWAYRAIGDQSPLWSAPNWFDPVAGLLMWLGSILFAGSFVGNPALAGARAQSAPRGVLAITRHPMMWGFAIWALVHVAIIATPKALILDGGILVLALAGAAGQDRKKARIAGQDWHDWTARTAFVPFARGLAAPGLLAAVAGTILFLAATWAHGPLAGMPTGPWRWLG